MVRGYCELRHLSGRNHLQRGLSYCSSVTAKVESTIISNPNKFGVIYYTAMTYPLAPDMFGLMVAV